MLVSPWPIRYLQVPGIFYGCCSCSRRKASPPLDRFRIYSFTLLQRASLFRLFVAARDYRSDSPLHNPNPTPYSLLPTPYSPLPTPLIFKFSCHRVGCKIVTCISLRVVDFPHIVVSIRLNYISGVTLPSGCWFDCCKIGS